MIFNKAALLIAGGFAYNVAAHGYIKSCSVNGQVYVICEDINSSRRSRRLDTRATILATRL